MSKTNLSIRVNDAHNPEAKAAIEQAIKALSESLPSKAASLITGTKVTIANGLINSGAQTNAETKKIILDSQKNTLSLQQAEDFLIDANILEKGDWTTVLPQQKDKIWSCLTYQLVHEIGHVIDGLSKGNTYKRLPARLSPTKYGTANESEAFAEAFTYWIFGQAQNEEAIKVIKETLYRQ